MFRHSLGLFRSRSQFAFKKKAIVCCMFLLVSNTSYPLDESRLWLPTNFEHLYIDLKHAASHAESLDKCEKVLRATIDIEQSTVKDPVYRVLCRQSSGKTYNEMVEPNKKPPSEELIAEQKRERKHMMLEQCLNALKKKTELFSKKVIHSKQSEFMAFSMTQSNINIPFDAETPEGQALRYNGKCDIEWGKDTRISVQRRIHQ